MPRIYENQTPRIKGGGLHYTAFAPSTGTSAAAARACEAGKDFLTVELGLTLQRLICEHVFTRMHLEQLLFPELRGAGGRHPVPPRNLAQLSLAL